MTFRRGALGFVLIVALAGCGDDGGSGGGLSDEEQEFVDAAMAEFDAEQAAPLKEEDAECIVTSMVEVVGVDDLEEAGITAESFSEEGDLPQGLTEDQAADVAGAIDSCVDLREVFLEGLAQDASLPDEVRDCLAEQFDDDFITRLMVVMLSEGEQGLADSELTQELMTVFEACPGALTN